MSDQINTEDNLWSSFEKSAAELSVGSKLKSSNGITLEKVSEQTWEYASATTKISYNNNSIDSFKSIESVTFNVETN